MASSFDLNFWPRLTLTAITTIYAIALLAVDMNKTHASNPTWTPHARFHVVWQILSYVGFSIMGLILLWKDSSAYILQIHIAAGLVFCVMAAFYISLITMKIYGGNNYDSNGIPPKPITIIGKTVNVDANIMVFSVMTAALLAAWYNIR